MNKIITVKSTEMATIQKGPNTGNSYMKVHGSDDKTYSIFAEGLWGLFFDGSAIELTIEKNQKGFWDVTSAKSAAQDLAEKLATEPNGASKGQGVPIKKPEGTPNVEPSLKNRAFALSYAKDLAVADKIGVADIRRWAEEFSKWLDGII